MSGLTGSDAKGLMEAYQAVYAPQKLTEEQVWEEVENWVNSLLEEGYDLSDYTWEEMYENYISEKLSSYVEPTEKNLARTLGGPGYDPDRGTTIFGNEKKGYTPYVIAPRGGVMGAMEPGKPKTWKRTAGTNIRTDNTRYRTLRGDDQMNKDDQNNKFKKDINAKMDAADDDIKRRIAAARLAVPPKPAAGTAPKPAVPTTSATAKPAATPATKPAAPSFERRLPTSAELRAAQEARKSALEAGKSKPDAETAAVNAGVVRGQQQATADAIVKRGAVAVLKPAGTATPTAPRNGFGVDARKLAAQSSVNSSFDLFDVVLGHLLDEGYADTKKQAAAMIPHLGESWISNIIGNIIINEHFTDCVNSMIDNGYDLSQYSVEDLFEEYSVHLIDVVSEQYGCSDKQLDLHEIVPLIAAGAATAPAWMPAAAAGLTAATALYALNKKKIDDAAGRAVQSASDFVMQARNRNRNRTPTGTSRNIDANKIRGGGGPGGGSGGGGGGKEPPIDTFRTLKDVKDGIGKAFDQTLGKTARARILGGTRPGQLTRAGGIAIGSAADLIPKIGGSDKPSNLAKLGSFGPGVLGNLANLASEIPGVKGSSTEDGLKGAGSFLKSQGQGMWDQGATSTSQQPANPGPKTKINWGR